MAEANHPIRTACLNHRVSAAFTACSMAWHVCSASKTHIETVTSSKSQEGVQQSCARTIASLATSPALPLLTMTVSNKLPNIEWGRSMMLACAIARSRRLSANRQCTPTSQEGEQKNYWPLHMPLVMLCGLPCAGKTSVATMLAKYLKEAGQDVALIDDSIAHLSRNEGYKGRDRPELPVQVCAT